MSSFAERSVASGFAIASPTLGRWSRLDGLTRSRAIACSTRCWRTVREMSLSAGFVV
jgi:hypothetical protein